MDTDHRHCATMHMYCCRTAGLRPANPESPLRRSRYARRRLAALLFRRRRPGGLNSSHGAILASRRTPAARLPASVNSALMHAFLFAQGIDLKAGGRNKKKHRTAPKSENVYLKLLVKVRHGLVGHSSRQGLPRPLPVSRSKPAGNSACARPQMHVGISRPLPSVISLTLTCTCDSQLTAPACRLRSCTLSWRGGPTAASTRWC